jgi:hypothetical protein
LAIRITRDHFLPDRTLGTVHLDLPDDSAGFLPFGFSAEDPDRHLEEHPEAKIRGATAIPLGTYKVHLYDSPKHGPDTPELLSVPGYGHVQIHPGNGPADTEGCLLFGLARTDSMILRSRLACTWLRAEIIRVIRAGGEVTVEIRRAP